MPGPFLFLGPGLDGLRPDKDPCAGSRRLEPRVKEEDPPPDDFPGLEPTLTSALANNLCYTVLYNTRDIRYLLTLTIFSLTARLLPSLS